MDFMKNASRNIVRGALVGAIVVTLISVLFLCVGHNRGVQAKAGWNLRIVWLFVAGATWGGIMGLGCTKPAQQNVPMSILLVAIAVVASIAVAFVLDYVISDTHEIADVMGFALFGPAPLAGIICGCQQFSGKSKKSENSRTQK